MPFSGDKLPVVVGRFIPEGVVMRDPRKNVSVVMFLKCCICIASAISVNINPYAGRVALDICMYGMCVCLYVELWTIGEELSSSESTFDLVMFTSPSA